MPRYDLAMTSVDVSREFYTDFNAAFAAHDKRQFGKEVKTTRVMPGLHLTLGVTLIYLSLIVLVPLAVLDQFVSCSSYQVM